MSVTVSGNSGGKIYNQPRVDLLSENSSSPDSTCGEFVLGSARLLVAAQSVHSS